MNLRPLLLSTFLISFFCSISQAQTSDEIHYYKYRWDDKESSASKAKYAKHIRLNADGTTTTEWRYIPNDAVIQTESYRDGIPVGLWITANDNGKILSERDYRFDLKYTGDSCTAGYRYRFGSDSLVERTAGTFVPPQLKGYKSVMDMLIKDLRYPDASREAGTEGKVVVTMKLTEDGRLTDIMILQSADKMLDAEAARMFFNKHEWTPATLNGKPIPLCMTFPITFRLN
jgi:TonB family protein